MDVGGQGALQVHGCRCVARGGQKCDNRVHAVRLAASLRSVCCSACCNRGPVQKEGAGQCAGLQGAAARQRPAACTQELAAAKAAWAGLCMGVASAQGSSGRPRCRGRCMQAHVEGLPCAAAARASRPKLWALKGCMGAEGARGCTADSPDGRREHRGLCGAEGPKALDVESPRAEAVPHASPAGDRGVHAFTTGGGQAPTAVSAHQQVHRQPDIHGGCCCPLSALPAGAGCSLPA